MDLHPKHLSIADFTYNLPEEKIAKFPLAQRDKSKLLIYQNGEIKESQYQNIANFLPQNALLVFNQSKVVHARLLFQKPTGGKIEVFCLEPDARYADVQTAMQMQQEVYWACFLGGASKWKTGQLLEIIEENGLKIFAEMISKNEGTYTLRIFWNKRGLSFAEILHIAGKVPLPPYLNREATVQDETTYQTIFAKEEGSVAAPTAALHFTDAVLEDLAKKNIDTTFVTLHVGAGTFKPVKSEVMDGHEMHSEWIAISKNSILKILTQLKNKQAIVAVGTTSCRTLESLYWIGFGLQHDVAFLEKPIAVSQWFAYENNACITAEAVLENIVAYLDSKKIEKLVTKTQIIIAPGYAFKIVNGLVTNFHQSESTLLLLVAAMVGENWKMLYQHALAHDYRFLSYGDGCLLWGP